MIHRHITTSDWSLMAIDSLMDRGTLADWREFARALAADPEIARRAMTVSRFREPDGAEGIALTLIEHAHPWLLQASHPSSQSDTTVN